MDLLRSLEDGAVGGIEVLALDRGPGMANINDHLADFYSTADSSGTGLGAIVRLSGFFDIYSVPGRGTALLSRLWPGLQPKNHQGRGLSIGVVNLPKPGEKKCGDGWAANSQPGQNKVLVSDGLGHGPLAAEASDKAVRIFMKNLHLAPAKILEAIHLDLRGTRGAAVAVAEVDLGQRVVLFTGVGNIAGLIFSPQKTKSMVSYNGTAGERVHKIREFTYPWPEGAILIMHIAGVLYRDYSRGRDDVTVLVAKSIIRQD